MDPIAKGRTFYSRIPEKMVFRGVKMLEGFKDCGNPYKGVLQALLLVLQ
jgi:hypothetical protein